MIYISPLSARIANRLGLLQTFRIGYTLRILKSVFKIPIIENREGFMYHLVISEPFVLHVYQQLYNAKDFMFVDVGVNFGQTLLKIKAVSAAASYIGLEPSGLCSYYTSHLIRINQLSDAQIIRCALADKAGILTLSGHSEGDTTASILEPSISEGQASFKEYVPVVTLDSLIPIIVSTGKEILLKIDVEGAEWMVFEGGEGFINQFRPVIVFENLPARQDNTRQQQQQLMSDFLTKKDFDLYLMDETNVCLLPISHIDNEEDLGKTNYIAIPSEKSLMFPQLLHEVKNTEDLNPSYVIK